jgi:hypothetical protein
MRASSNIGFISCSALRREICHIIRERGWNAGVIPVPAENHLYPQRIAPAVDALILSHRKKFDRLVVVYGDCGTKGKLDRILERHGIPRVPAPHCYAMYAGDGFYDYLDQEPETFFLTDYLVSVFFDSVVTGLGLDRFPQLKSDYFSGFTHLIYLAQEKDPALLNRAQIIADYLELPLETLFTGTQELDRYLVSLVAAVESV